MADVDVQVTISFEGMWLKGYCVAHDCPHLAGPVEVLLFCSTLQNQVQT
jgi:hypothetical protein